MWLLRNMLSQSIGMLRTILLNTAYERETTDRKDWNDYLRKGYWKKSYWQWDSHNHAAFLYKLMMSTLWKKKTFLKCRRSSLQFYDKYYSIHPNCNTSDVKSIFSETSYLILKWNRNWRRYTCDHFDAHRSIVSGFTILDRIRNKKRWYWYNGFFAVITTYAIHRTYCKQKRK